jgi:hypothetical protein
VNRKTVSDARESDTVNCSTTKNANTANRIKSPVTNTQVQVPKPAFPKHLRPDHFFISLEQNPPALIAKLLFLMVDLIYSVEEIE